jgi:hypothetical protein
MIEGGVMFSRLLHFLRQLSGALLGGIGISIQVGNILICIFLLMLGPAFVVDLFAQ